MGSIELMIGIVQAHIIQLYTLWNIRLVSKFPSNAAAKSLCTTNKARINILEIPPDMVVD